MENFEGGFKMKQCRLKIERLKEYIARNNMSEKEFAEKIGISYPEFYRVLRGIRNPGAKFIASLLDACGDLKYEDVFYSEEISKGKSKNKDDVELNFNERRKGFPVFLKYYQGIEGEFYNSEEEKPIKVYVCIDIPNGNMGYSLDVIKSALKDVFKRIIDEF